MPEPIVYIVDDDEAVRDSIATLVSLHGYSCRTFASARDYLDHADLSVAACVVLDVKMPGLSGLDLQQEMRLRDIRHGILFVTGHGAVELAVRAMKAGALDFLEKPFDQERLLDGIRAALARVSGQNPSLAGLTPREREVAGLIADGLTSKEIAQRLTISVRTVDIHRANVMTKTGSRNVADLVRMLVTTTGAHAGLVAEHDYS